MPFHHYCARGIAWYMWEQPVVAICGLVPVCRCVSGIYGWHIRADAAVYIGTTAVLGNVNVVASINLTKLIIPSRGNFFSCRC